MNIRKITLYFTTVIILLLAACSDEPVQEETLIPEEEVQVPKVNRVLSVNASVPDELQSDIKSTRISLTQEGDKSISLTWQSGDVLHLLIVQADTKISKAVTIKETDISTDGKRATFEILLPDEITDDNFDLYIVYGGGGLLVNDPTFAILPKNSGNAESLTLVQDRKDIMLTYSITGVPISKENINATLKHLGSIFSITLKNLSNTSVTNLSEARLVSTEAGWAYNNGTGANTYNLVTGEFQGVESAGDYLSFKASKSIVESEDSITFWGWHPSLPDIFWPELQLELLSLTGDLLYKTSNSLKAKIESIPAGKCIYSTVIWNGDDLIFPNGDNFYDLYLLVGQSNMVGRGVIEEEDLTIHPRVFSLGEGDVWVPAKEPLHNPGRGTGPGLTFGKTMADMMPYVKVGLIPAAVGGTRISYWHPENESRGLYVEAIRKAKAAMLNGRIKGIIWQQGESDSATHPDISNHKGQLIYLINSFRQDLGDENIPVVIGGLGDFLTSEYWNDLNNVFREIAAEVPNVAFSEASKLGHIGDNLHFNAKAQRENGRNMAESLLKAGWGNYYSDPVDDFISNYW